MEGSKGSSALVRYKYEVLFIFVLFEVLLYQADESIQLVAAVFEYAFVAYALLSDRNVGIMYFLSFSILALGQETHVISETLPNTFWGMRAFGFSFHVIFSFLVFAYCVVNSRIRYVSVFDRRNTQFLPLFITYSFGVGLISVAYSINYYDNFLRDVMVFAPFFVYIYLISAISRDSLLKAVRYTLSLAVITMILSVILDSKFQYYEGDEYYALCGSYIFIAPIAILLSYDIYERWQYVLLLAATGYLIVSGNFFMGGKFIVMAVVTAIWIGLSSRRFYVMGVGVLLIIIYYIGPIFSYFIDFYSGGLISYKFSQISEVFGKLDVELLAATRTSIGNIFAEAATIYRYIADNGLYMVFGKGFGGGVPDIFGYLSPYAGEAGYQLQDVYRNDFLRMHLPVFEIMLKAGLVGLSFYVLLLAKNILAKKSLSFICFLLLLTVFYVSKELLLLTIIFMQLSQEACRLPHASCLSSIGALLPESME